MKKVLLLIASILLYIFCMLISSKANAQNVGINATGATPSASAGLDVSFTDKGMLIPRIALTGTTDVTTISSPATSLLVYNTASAGSGANAVVPGYYYYDGSVWTRMLTNSGTLGAWSLTGNSGTSAATNFLGTTDSTALNFRVNGHSAGRIGLYTPSDANTSFGNGALASNATGGENCAFGNRALYSNNGGYYNIAVGSFALASNTTGGVNIAVGENALTSNSVGVSNTAIGESCLYSNTTAYYNIAVGSQALYSNTSGGNNTALGYHALYANITGSDNIAIGERAAFSQTSGTHNIAIGYDAIGNSTSGGGNIGIGAYALLNINGVHNIGIGYATTSGVGVTGSYNTCVGYQASFTTGVIHGTAIGENSQISLSYGVNIGSANASVGISQPNPVSRLDVDGNMTVGSGYSGVTSAPVNGAIFEGQTGIGTNAPSASAKLEISSTTTGLLIPRIALTATNAASPVTSPATSLLVYNTANAGSGGTAVSPGYYYWDGAAWSRFQTGSSTSSWSLTGNTGTNDPASPATYGTSTIGATEDYIGTTDAQDLVFGTNNTERMRILKTTGNIGIGTAAPAYPLDVYKVSDANKSVINAYASQTSISTDYQNRAVVGIARGANTLYGYAVGVAGVADKNNSYFATGVYAALGNSAPSGVQNDQALMADGGNLGFSGIFTGGNVGIGTLIPYSTLDVSGSVGMKVKPGLAAGTTNPDATAMAWIYSSGTGTITLPGASACTNRMYVIVNYTGAARTISGYTSIAGTAGTTSIANASSIWIISDGTNWYQIK